MVCFYHIERGTASVYKLNLDKILKGSQNSITIKESKVNWTLIEKGNRMWWNWPSPREAVLCISIFIFFKNPKRMLIGSMRWWGKWKERKGKQRKQEKEEKTKRYCSEIHTVLRTSSLCPSTPPNIATNTSVLIFQSLRLWSAKQTKNWNITLACFETNYLYLPW